jgi:hypothetical protein
MKFCTWKTQQVAILCHDLTITAYVDIETSCGKEFRHENLNIFQYPHKLNHVCKECSNKVKFVCLKAIFKTI